MPDGSKNPDQKGIIDGIMQDYELRYRIMSENITMGMFRLTLSSGSDILSTNLVMARMLGYNRPEELAGKPLSDLMAVPLDIENLASGIRREGSFTGREILLKRRDGSEMWVQVQAWKVGTSSSPVMMIEGFAEDITEQKVFEQEVQYHESELNRYALELSQANRKLNILSTITRHDILNKLTGLQGYLELMKGEYYDPRLQEYLAIQETIIQTIARQIRFTKDYQDIGVETPRWFDVRETIEKAAAGLPLEAVTLTVETGDLRIYADPMLEKVFYNLVENSLRHGEKLTRIRCTADISGECARIIVEDDGGGVPERFKEAIFVRKHFKNTGFGLSLSREILGITGLSIRERGTPGEGALFEITIPRQNYLTGDSAR
ncbi:MAG: PAS domain-containing sensor histidine kinase [Methanoregulaceae archaeon]|nr:MAG: PAS domain-containing sensor histidine kinase [Methanoregulaceae archaeon]